MHEKDTALLATVMIDDAGHAPVQVQDILLEGGWGNSQLWRLGRTRTAQPPEFGQSKTRK